ncbi:MAG TPA: fatty acid desaturase [Holophaga sp.]|nr:fatty acid desaturase [Holophaga sp.]
MATKGPWNLLNTAFLVGTLLLALVLVPLHVLTAPFRWEEWAVSLGLVFAIGTAISAGYHRLFSHRAYQASAPVRFVLLCLGAASFENSALKWASDHRLHHRHVDTDQDPYSIRKGFWHAHWLWVMAKGDTPLVAVADLEKDPIVRWQHRHHFVIGASVALLPPLAVGLATGNLAGHLVVGVLLRIVLTHHTTFLINSAAHWFGTRPYTDANSARDNALLAPLTYGEGFHNFHHLWAWDYRNGVKWHQWDSTKWLLALLAAVGLVKGLRRVPVAMIRRAEVAMEAKALQARLERAEPRHSEALRAQIATARDRLDRSLAAWQAHQEARKTAWAQRRSEWQASLDQHQRELAEAWSEWKAARRAVNRLAYA